MMMVSMKGTKFAKDLEVTVHELPGITHGLRMNVYRRGSGGDSGNGVTTKADAVLALFVSDRSGHKKEVGPIEVARSYIPVLYVINCHFNGETNDWIAVPTIEAALAALKGRHSGFMFGGNFIYTTDGRKPYKYPIPVHDRVE